MVIGRAGLLNLFFFQSVLLPSLLFFTKIASSYALGLSAGCSIVLALVFAGGMVSIPQYFLIGLIVCLTFISAQLLVLSFGQTIWFEKAEVSIVLVLVIALACAAMANLAVRVPPKTFHKIIRRCAILLLVIGFFGVFFGRPIGNHYGWRQPIPPFSEPSHFVLALTPFAIYIFASREWRLSGLFAVLAALLLLVKGSASFAALLLLIILVRVPIWTSIALVPVLGLAAVNLLTSGYYFSRFFFWHGTNLSALVYRQGWETILASVFGSNIFGLGFQQLGRVDLGLSASSTISAILNGGDLNLLDGGFVAAKIFGEFGLLAVPLVALLLLMIARSFLVIRSCVRGGVELPPLELFARCAVFGYVLELFVRGIGYFSVGGLLLLFSLAVLSRPHLKQYRTGMLA